MKTSSDNPRPRGRPRGTVPYVERAELGRLRWRRVMPPDVQHILGDAVYHNFDHKTATPEHVEAVAKSLTRATDAMIENARARLNAGGMF